MSNTKKYCITITFHAYNGWKNERRESKTWKVSILLTVFVRTRDHIFLMTKSCMIHPGYMITHGHTTYLERININNEIIFSRLCVTTPPLMYEWGSMKSTVELSAARLRTYSIPPCRSIRAILLSNCIAVPISYLHKMLDFRKKCGLKMGHYFYIWVCITVNKKRYWGVSIDTTR